MPVEVLLVAADPLVLDALAARLEDRPEVTVIGRTAPEDASFFTGRAQVILWDLGPGPELDLDALLEVTRSEIPVIVLVEGAEGAAAAWRAGARGIVRRTASAVELVMSLLAAAVGLIVLDPDLAWTPWQSGVLEPAGMPEALTPRELEVLRLVADGLSNKEIARQLDISVHTVKFHLNTILSKLGARSRTEAVVIAARLGLIPI